MEITESRSDDARTTGSRPSKKGKSLLGSSPRKRNKSAADQEKLTKSTVANVKNSLLQDRKSSDQRAQGRGRSLTSLKRGSRKEKDAAMSSTKETEVLGEEPAKVEDGESTDKMQKTDQTDIQDAVKQITHKDRSLKMISETGYAGGKGKEKVNEGPVTQSVTADLLETQDLKSTLLYGNHEQELQVWLSTIIDQVEQGKSKPEIEDEFSSKVERPPKTRRPTPRRAQSQEIVWGLRKRKVGRLTTIAELLLEVPEGEDEEQQWPILLKEDAAKPSRKSSRPKGFQRFHKPSVKPAKIVFQVAARRRGKGMTSRSRLGKRKRRHSYLQNLLPWNARGNTLDSQLLLDEGGVAAAENLRYVKLANLGINHVDTSTLLCFTALQCLDLSENYVAMESLSSFCSLRKLNLQCNQLFELVIPHGSFEMLEVLDVSYNHLDPLVMVTLSLLPSLHKLNMDYNNLEVIPDVTGMMNGYRCLRKLSAAGNGLSDQCLLTLSKLPLLERLHLQHNLIRGVPEQLKLSNDAFRRLEVLDLTSNPVEEPHALAPLNRILFLRKVMLWDTPLAAKVAYDTLGRCLPISKPILKAALEAQEAGQHWILEEPDHHKRSPVQQYEGKLKNVVHPPKPFQPVIFSDGKMVAAFDKLSQELDESSKKLDEHLLAGSISTSMPPSDGMEAQVAIADTEEMLPISSPFPPPHMQEELRRISSMQSPLDPHLSEANAAVTSLKLALKMIPFREADLDPPSYRRPTRIGVIRFHQQRISLHPPLSPWKKALYLARKFANRNEREARTQVRSVLDVMQLQLANIERRIEDINSENNSNMLPSDSTSEEDEDMTVAKANAT